MPAARHADADSRDADAAPHADADRRDADAAPHAYADCRDADADFGGHADADADTGGGGRLQPDAASALPRHRRRNADLHGDRDRWRKSYRRDRFREPRRQLHSRDRGLLLGRSVLGRALQVVFDAIGGQIVEQRGADPPLVGDDGLIPVPEGPGLGVEIDGELIV